MKKLIATIMLAAGMVLITGAIMWPMPTKQPNPPRPENFLGRSGDNPDNWQAQSQKKEGAWFCPPFCEVQEKGRWRTE